MTMLHKGENAVPLLENGEGERASLCSNRAALRSPSSRLSNPLSKETLKALDELGLVLRRIRQRMHSEGYTILHGKVVKE